jgi:hypothetical protein
MQKLAPHFQQAIQITTVLAMVRPFVLMYLLYQEGQEDWVIWRILKDRIEVRSR